MNRILLWTFLVGLLSAGPAYLAAEDATLPSVKVSPSDWPWWRGPTRNGIAEPNQQPPLNWSENEGVLWKVPLPGRGHGSATVVGEQVFLATADERDQTQSVLCFARETGELRWQTEIHRGGFTNKGNKKSTHASSSVACDGTRLFINFFHDGAIHTTALSREGKQLWQTRVSDYVVHQGFGSSPAVYQSLVLVSADNKGGGAVKALDRATGKTIWEKQRPKTPNYASPIILKVADRDQLILTGCNLVTSLAPLTGRTLWEIPGATTECVTSTVTDGNLIYTSGGYPKNHVAAVRGDGSGKVVWENKSGVYVPSMICRDGTLFGLTDAGVAMCWKAGTGEELWKGRLGGTFTSSPVLVGDHIYAVNESGKSFVYKATSEAFELVAENQLGDAVFATPSICGGSIYYRAAFYTKNGRQEMLYRLGRAE